jgi:hypothetical protein
LGELLSFQREQFPQRFYPRLVPLFQKVPWKAVVVAVSAASFAKSVEKQLLFLLRLL